ncbi:hypothetical protein ACQRXC_27100 (plasmid) [Niallia taxi]|uniref:YhfM-like domain-containing protein n=1 Tax=Niallia taxi TaxID=2499688 RepID=A0A437K2Q7_9BACI|nr:hypothetical protein [Niallia taxi]MDK8643926.1 hypothetical protein [Niallia taxi]MED4057385.1 hypothetical protein [Niallia taxi]RVT56143.1 hypothetical protein EM808_28280 [Niallia taxi]
MRNFFLFIGCFALISSLLLGCGTNNGESNGVNTNSSQEKKDNKKLKLNGEIIKFSISQNEGASEVNLNDKQSLEVLTTFVSNSQKESSVANMDNPDYYIHVYYEKEDKQILKVWVGENGEKSTLMDSDDTHGIYTVPEDDAREFIELLKSISNKLSNP